MLGGALGPPSELQNGLCGSWTFQPHLAGDDADGGQIERRGLASWFRRFFFSTGAKDQQRDSCAHQRPAFPSRYASQVHGLKVQRFARLTVLGFELNGDVIDTKAFLNGLFECVEQRVMVVGAIDHNMRG